MAKGKKNSSVICRSRRVRFDYEILDTLEGGLVLMGSEVKSLRAGKGNINEAYANFVGNELYLIGANIAPYENAGYMQHEPDRLRKILLHKKELEKLKMAREAKGLTLMPLKLYWKKSLVKIELVVARGKKQFDKRETVKRRDWDRNKHRILKNDVRD